MAAKRRRDSGKPARTIGPRGRRGKTGKRGPAGKDAAGHIVAALADKVEDLAKEVARLFRRIGELQAQLDRVAATDSAERTGTR